MRAPIQCLLESFPCILTVVSVKKAAGIRRSSLARLRSNRCAVARHGRNVGCGMDYRVAVETKAKFRVLVLYSEQCIVGALGLA